MMNNSKKIKIKIFIKCLKYYKTILMTIDKVFKRLHQMDYFLNQCSFKNHCQNKYLNHLLEHLV